MAESIPLENLFSHGLEKSRVIALRAGESVDFASFANEAAAWVAAFSAAPGKNWAMFFEDSVDFAAALFGAWYAGKRVYLPADALPGTIERLAGEVDGFVGEFSGVPVLSNAVAGAGGDWAPLDREAEALVIYTSGSSGEPVSVPKKLGQLFAEVDTQTKCWGEVFDAATVHSTVSHQHIYGLLFRVLVPLAAGCPFAAERLRYPEDIVAALAGSGSMVLVASPAHLKRLSDTLDWNRVRDGLRAVFSSGGPLPEEALSACLALLGKAPIEIYGSSETGGVAWRQRSSQHMKYWRLLPGVEIRQVQGEAQVRSPHLPDTAWFGLSDRIRSGGGDMPEGEFDLLGRSDRVVKVEEKRVSLTAVEQRLLASDLVCDVRVLPLPGERVVLGGVVVPGEKGWALYQTEGKRALNARLRALLSSEMEACVLPRRWRYVPALPVDAQGKTTEKMLMALFDRQRPSACLLNRNECEATIRIDIGGDSHFFDGHFPRNPILPGVTQINWAIIFGRELFPLPPCFRGMENIKFQQIIEPGASVQLALKFNPERGSLGFKFTSGAGTHAAGKIVFGDAA